MNNDGQFDIYNVDVCLCIDKTGSMQPIMDVVKKNALNLYEDVRNSLEQKGKRVGQFRIRVIWFGDYIADKDPMLVSDFLTMPDQVTDYQKFVNSISPNGGGDEPEDGLEALAYAIRSDWCTEGWKKRHIIALFTDASTHDLGFGRHAASYPVDGMPRDFTELSDMWGDEDFPGEMDFSAKRLLLFAPDNSYWHTIKNTWDNVVIRPAREATGLEDLSYQAMLNTIVNSV